MREVAPGLRVLPVRTPTLPPATHTNTYVVGDGALSVFDPASPWEDEQQRLIAALDVRLERGERVERIVLTHHHADHVGGAIVLKEQLAQRGLPVPIVAHPATTDLLTGLVAVDLPWHDGVILDCGGRDLQAHHTPGHAPGHLVFQDAESGAMIAGDMVAGVGTIAISPDDGHLGRYLASLERMRALQASVLLPAHGEPLPHAETLLSFYIAHRHGRTEQMRLALKQLGNATPLDVATVVYAGEIDDRFLPLAAAQVLSHLLWMAEHNLASPVSDSTHWRAT